MADITTAGYPNFHGAVLDPAGEYPGKKVGFWENFKRAASFGAYNPSDKDATAYNQAVQKAAALGDSSVLMKEKEDEALLNTLTKHLMQGGQAPDEHTARVLAAQIWTGEKQAQFAEQKQRMAQAANEENRAKGMAPRAQEIGAQQAYRDIAKAGSEAATADRIRKRATQENALGVSEAEAANTLAAEGLKGLSIGAESDEAKRAHESAQNTSQYRTQIEQNRARQGANVSAADVNVTNDPAFMNDAARMRAMRDSSITIPHLGTLVTPRPFTADVGMSYNQPASLSPGYQITSTTTDPLTGLPIAVKDTVRHNLPQTILDRGQNAPPTTASPPPAAATPITAPGLAPNAGAAKPGAGKRLSPEELKSRLGR